jgi:hypothetical protein
MDADRISHMYVCVYVCMYGIKIHKRACVWLRIHAHISLLRISTHVLLPRVVCLYIYIYIHIYIYIYIYIPDCCVYTHTNTYLMATYRHTHTHTHTHLMAVYTHIQYTHAHIHTLWQCTNIYSIHMHTYTPYGCVHTYIACTCARTYLMAASQHHKAPRTRRMINKLHAARQEVVVHTP